MSGSAAALVTTKFQFYRHRSFHVPYRTQLQGRKAGQNIVEGAEAYQPIQWVRPNRFRKTIINLSPPGPTIVILRCRSHRGQIDRRASRQGKVKVAPVIFISDYYFTCIIVWGIYEIITHGPSNGNSGRRKRDAPCNDDRDVMWRQGRTGQRSQSPQQNKPLQQPSDAS